MSERIHVVAAVIMGSDGRIFLSKRPQSKHQGGLWEFPGGKLEPREAPVDALSRELEEELGIQVEACSPLIKVSHDYADKSVLLDVWSVSQFQGEPHGREGQETAWVHKQQLQNLDFPAANKPILEKLIGG